MNVKLPGLPVETGQDAGASRARSGERKASKRNFILIVPLHPAYKAGLAGHLPAKIAQCQNIATFHQFCSFELDSPSVYHFAQALNFVIKFGRGLGIILVKIITRFLVILQGAGLQILSLCFFRLLVC